MKNRMNNSWLNPHIEIRESSVSGKGMFAAREFRTGETLIVWGGNGYTNKAGAMQAVAEGKPVMQWDDEIFSFAVECEDESPFLINHSCDPNAWMSDAYTISARRNIHFGEEITADYALWENNTEGNLSWPCKCNSKLCRKNITGRDWQNPFLQKQYQGHFSPLLNKKIQRETTKIYSPFTLTGNNLILRDFQQKDLTAYAKWLEPGHAWQNFDGPYYRQTLPATNPRLEKRKMMIESSSFPDPRMHVVIADIKTDALIGEVNCYWNSAETFWMSMGVDIFDSSLWGRGYGGEALTLWTQYLFDSHPKLARLGLETWSGNLGMIKLALRLGFKEEARIRKARIVKDEYFDALSFGILREEWRMLG